MNEDTERRVRERARRLWQEAGRPQSGIAAYVDQARELVAVEDNQKLTRRPLKPGEDAGAAGEPRLSAEQAGPSGEPVEPLEAVENAGEFPTLTDEGEGPVAPQRRRRTAAGEASPVGARAPVAKRASVARGAGKRNALRAPARKAKKARPAKEKRASAGRRRVKIRTTTRVRDTPASSKRSSGKRKKTR